MIVHIFFLIFVIALDKSKIYIQVTKVLESKISSYIAKMIFQNDLFHRINKVSNGQ